MLYKADLQRPLPRVGSVILNGTDEYKVVNFSARMFTYDDNVHGDYHLELTVRRRSWLSAKKIGYAMLASWMAATIGWMILILRAVWTN